MDVQFGFEEITHLLRNGSRDQICLPTRGIRELVLWRFVQVEEDTQCTRDTFDAEKVVSVCLILQTTHTTHSCKTHLFAGISIFSCWKS